MALPAIILHIRNYASAGLIAALAGLITFPILIRNLSVEEYGILGLITSTLTLFVAVSKLGIQHSIIRFYAQVKENNSDFSLVELNSTVFMLFLGLAALGSFIWVGAGVLLLPRVLNYEGLEVLFIATCGIVFVLLINSAVVNFLRAQQRSGKVAFYQVFSRYLHLGFVLALLLSGDLEPLYILLALMVTEILAAVFLLHAYFPDLKFAVASFSSRLAKMLLIYGLPLMVLESLGLVLRASDRYIIEALLGTASLGQYSASYNLVSYLELVIIAGVMQPIRPMYTAIWESEGKNATANFLSDGFYFYLVIGLPIITIFSLAAPHLLNLLSNPEYEPGTVIMPWVAFSFYLEGAVLFLGAGLYLHKNTGPLMFWGMIATFVNLSLNFIAIPWIGIQGAAMVTVVSYLIFCFGIARSAFKSVSFSLYVTPVLFTGAICILVYLLVGRIEIESEFQAMLLKGTLATFLLAAGLYALDMRVSSFVRGKLCTLVPRSAK